IFTNNVVEGLRNVFFQVGNVPSFKNVVVKDNIVNFNPQSSSQPLFLLKHGHDGATLYNSTIIGNDVTVERGIYNKIDETLKIDYNSCDFDSILYPESDLELELWGSGGEVDNIEYHLKVSKINNIVNVVGNIVFDVTQPNSLIRLSGLPRQNHLVKIPKSVWFYADYNNDFRKGLISHNGVNRSKLLISYDDTRHNEPFPVGTNYMVSIDINYTTHDLI